MVTKPVTLCGLRFDPELCAADAGEAFDIVAELRSRYPELKSWITFPLLNSTGSPVEFSLSSDCAHPRWTPYAARLKHTIAAIARIEAAGVRVQQARVAVLLNRDVLRTHIDEYPSTRLLLALNEQGCDFRHVFDDTCFTMRTGQLWRVRGDVCHGAANVAAVGMRATVVLDITPVVPEAELFTDSAIPCEQLVERPEFTDEVREMYDREASDLLRYGQPSDAERVWLFAPFEYNLRAADVYDEILAFAERNMERTKTVVQRRYWQRRAEYLLHPQLKFEVPPPHRTAVSNR